MWYIRFFEVVFKQSVVGGVVHVTRPQTAEISDMQTLCLNERKTSPNEILLSNSFSNIVKDISSEERS